jgi:diadenosine tetraphosphate (Ap4A) HIT family hydrolase
VAEAPEELYERAKDDLRMPPLAEWDTFPFDGEMRPRQLEPPTEVDRPRSGEGGIDCEICGRPDEEFLWTNERWRLGVWHEPPSIPMIALLFPREHHADPGDLPESLAAEFGVLVGQIERAIKSIGEIGRVHVCRWGDGSEHLHWWFMARPARLPQLIGSFVAIWEDVLPPLPEEVWEANVAALEAALE